jgi:hypothetical protein
MIQIMRDAREMILALWVNWGGKRTRSAVLALGIVCTDRDLAGRCVEYAFCFGLRLGWDIGLYSQVRDRL